MNVNSLRFYLNCMEASHLYTMRCLHPERIQPCNCTEMFQVSCHTPARSYLVLDRMLLCCTRQYLQLKYVQINVTKTVGHDRKL